MIHLIFVMAFAVLFHFMDEKPEVRVKFTQLLESCFAGILPGSLAQGSCSTHLPTKGTYICAGVPKVGNNIPLSVPCVSEKQGMTL